MFTPDHNKRAGTRKRQTKPVRVASTRKLRMEVLENRRVLVSEIAELTYQFFALNPDGSTGRNLDPNPNDSVLSAFVGVGERFVVRTLTRDLRSTPSGVFSAFSDFNYTNADGSSAEKMQLQWGEYNSIAIGAGALAGTFQMKYGANTTANISLGLVEVSAGTFILNGKQTASKIQSALERLPSIGVGNVLVTSKNQSQFSVSFVNALARTDIPNPEIVNNTLNTGGNAPASVAVTASGISNPSPTNPLTLEAAINKTPLPNQAVLYINGEIGNYIDATAVVPGKRVLEGVGGFSSVSFVPGAIAGNFFAVDDKIFIAGEAGVIHIGQTVTALLPNPNDGVGVAMYGGIAVYLTASQMILPVGTITIGDRIVAVRDSVSIVEDSGPKAINVLANDIDRFGTTRGVVAVTQPVTGGAVSFVNNGTNVEFVPAANYFGQTYFTYTVRNNLGDEAVGVVTVEVLPVNDAPTLNSISDISIARNASAQSVNLTGISAGPNESQVVRIVATSSSPSFIPNPSVNYASPNGTGVLNFTPVADKFGTATITVLVSDDGTPSLQTTKTFKVTVAAPAGGYRNPSNPFDVDTDGNVAPLDYLNIVNLLNTRGASTSVVGLQGPPPFFDVDGDDLVTPLDGLKIVDYLNFGGPFNGTNPGVIQLSYGFFSLDGKNLDPNPLDSTLEAIVAPGEKFIVRTYVKDLRASPLGVFSVYSDFNYTNVDGSAAAKMVFDRTNSSPDYENAPFATLVDLTATIPGRRTLQKVGRFSSKVFIPPEIAGTFQPVYDTLFTAQGQGAIQISQSLASPGNEKLGISMILSSGSYLAASQVVLPTATITIREGLIATNDSFSINEDLGPTTLNLTANDVDRLGTSRGIVAVTQPPSGGLVTFAVNGSTIEFVPATNFFGTASFTYTLRNNLGDQTVGTVNIAVQPVNDAPTINTVDNLTVSRNASLQTVNLTGISAGPGESGAIRVGVSSSNPTLIPIPSLTYTSPNEVGSISFTPVSDKYGASDITLTVQDEAGLETRRTFKVIVTPPARGYQNPNNPLDVDNNGEINPLDYLIVINLLNSKGASTSVVGLPGPPSYFDVDGDDLVTPLDALKVADHLRNAPSSSSPPVLAKITYGFFAKDGRNLDPNPSDDRSEAIVGLGEQFIVRTFVRDMRLDPKGVFSAYSDFNYTNSDGTSAAKMVFESTSSSTDYAQAAFGKLVDMTATIAGKRILQKVGRTSNQIAFPVEIAGTTLAAYDTLFTARAIGVLQVSQTIPSVENERLGIAMSGGTGLYLTASQVDLPSATINIREGLDVSFPMTNWVSSSAPTLSGFVAETAKPGFVDAWVDFNQDGDWDDPEDRVANKVEVSTGWNIVALPIPKSTALGDRNARFRLSKVGGLTPNGALSEGDVSKDIRVTLDGGSLSSPSLYVDQLGAHEVGISNGVVTVKIAGRTVWSVPANELTKLTSINKSGVIVAELRDFSSAFPGAVRYNEATATVELKVAATSLDLSTYGTGNLQGVQTIDLRQSGANILSLKVEDVQQINSQRRLQVVMSADDTLTTPNAWVVQTGRVENGAWTQSYSNVDKITNVVRTLEVASARPWRNEVSRLDADGDTTVSPLDVLVLINGINANIFPSGQLPARQASSGSGFYDTDGDNSLSPLDVLLVINRINLGDSRRGGGEGELVRATDRVFSMETHYSDPDEWWARSTASKSRRGAAVILQYQSRSA